MASALDDVDRNLVSQDAGIVFAQVLVQHVEELCSEFNASGAATTDDERQESSPLLIGSGG